MPAHRATRPTTDRVREAVFSSLATWAGGEQRTPAEQLATISFLDLFAGSGAVGIEAASRGAESVVWVERDRATAALIGRNLSRTGLAGPAMTVVAAAVEHWLASAAVPAGGFDIIWADPPYELDAEHLAGIVTTLLARGWLAGDGLLVVERSTRGPRVEWPAGMEESWSRRYGETVVHYCRPTAGVAGVDPEGGVSLP